MASEPAVSGEAAAPDAAEKERLDSQDLAATDLLAATHLHRYEVAAALLAGAGRILDLCCGTGYGARILAADGARVHGVDVAPDAVAAARAALQPGESERVTFEEADALAFLRKAAQGDFDAVVCFEGMEHVPDPDAVARELERLALGGAKLLLSFPNSRGFDERNRFHVTDFGWEETRRLIGRFDSPIVLEQYLAEGSLVVPAGERPQEATTRLVGEADRDDPAWAGHWLVAVGVEPEQARTAAARLSAAAAPHQNAYMHDLERANASLLRANARLARGHLGVHDAAAASMVRRLEEMEQRAKAAEAEAEKWQEIADNNDWAFQDAELRLAALQARLALPRYAMVDALHDRLTALPGGRRFAAGTGRALKRLRR